MYACVSEKVDLGFAISTTALNAEDTFSKVKETVTTIMKKYGVGKSLLSDKTTQADNTKGFSDVSSYLYLILV